MALRLFLSFIAGIVLLAAAAPAQAQGGPLVVEMTGTARGRATVGAAELRIELEGLRPGAEHVVHVHAGTPAQPSASTGTLGRFTADAQGRGRLHATTATIGAGAQADLSREWLADGSRFVEVHAGDGAAVARAAIPSAAAADLTEVPGVAGLVIALSVAAVLLVIWLAMRLSPARLGRSV